MNKNELELFGYLTYKCHWLIHNHDLDSGWGDIVIKKNGQGYIFYIVERNEKFSYRELKDFNELVKFLADNQLVDQKDKDYLYSLIGSEKKDVSNDDLIDKLRKMKSELIKYFTNKICTKQKVYVKNDIDKG